MPPRERSGAGKTTPGGRPSESGKGRESGDPRQGEERLPGPVAAALEAVIAAPAELAVWDRLEATAVEHDSPLAAADAYRKALHEPHPAALLAALGERAARFHQEWLADRPALLGDILERVLEVEPSADWALKRLIVLLTLEESWDRLLAVYDRALQAMPERGRRVQLLEEAAQVAKDFVGNADRAIAYLQMLSALKPGDWQVAGSLERLLERQERWADLVALWRARLETATGDDARLLHVRIATTQIERLGSPAEALAETRRLLAEPGDGRDGLALGERLVSIESAPAALRLEALRLVEARHDRNGRPDLALGMVRAGLGFATGPELAALHRDAAERLAASGAGQEAARHLASLLGLCPDDEEVQDRLRRQCAAIGEHEPYAQGLAAAAAATTDERRRVALLLEAGDVHERLLTDSASAIAVYERARREPAAAPADRLRALRRLDERLDKEDRPAERLDVLEGLAELAPRPVERRNALGALARLCGRTGAVDRASAAWERCLEMDPADREALAGLVDVLAAAERWRPLIAALRRRMGASADEHQRRDDLVRIARLEGGPLGDPAAAIESWTEHERVFGPSPGGVDALVDLLASNARWEALGTLLSETATRDRARAATLAVRLGDTCRLHLGAPERAAAWYRRALEADPAHRDARAGLAALVETPESRAPAVAALLAAAVETDDWRLTLSLLEPRLALADGPVAAAAVLRESARLSETRADDRPAALAALCRALPLVPDDRTLEGEALRLGAETGEFATLARALEAAIANLPPGARRRVELSALRGDVCHSRLGDPRAALDAYRVALEGEPGRLDLRRLVIRAAGEIGRWDEVARALVTPLPSRETRERDLAPLCEAIAEETSGFAGLAAAVAAALPGAGLGAEATAEVGNRVATWYADRLRDPDAAEAALVRALDATPDDLPTLRRLAQVRRRAPGEGLYETLSRIAAQSPADLDPLVEATELARTLPLDGPRTLATASRLLDQAGRLLRLGTPSAGTRSREDATELALDTLVTGLLATGVPDDCRRAIAVELEGAALPLAAGKGRALRLAAARLAAERLGDRTLAIDIRRALVDERPDDAETAEGLAALYAAEDRLVDLAELRRRQLEQSTEPERRLALRLEIERLGAVLEERSDRVALLRANLDERPGHAVTIDAIAAVLTARRRHAELCDVLEEQATRVEDQGGAETAAQLWTRMARLAEEPLGDRPRAIRGHERAAAIGAAASTLDALGRLLMEEGNPEAAARWLDRWLTMTDEGVAPAIAVRLARAYLGCNRRHRAVACLERVLEQQPAAAEVRALLADLYRTAGAWEPLGQLLTDTTAFLTEHDELVATAREAHRLFRDEVGAPGRAVAALERAVAAVPDDTELCMALAVSLTAAARLDDARSLLQRMLAGTRRSPDRAAIHLQLGRVARGQGDMGTALAALEQAAAVDMGNVEILGLLGDTARQAGELERAERAYRGLLMMLRRQDAPVVDAAAAAPSVAVSVAETLLALYELATARGEGDKAAELLDSAFEAATHDGAEFTRLRERLGQRGELGVLADALGKRAVAAKSPEAQAEAYREIADVRTQLGDDAGAFEAVLAALQAMPEDAGLHARAREVARAAGLIERYLDMVETVVDRRRRRDDGPLVAKLLLTAGDIVENDLADPPRALGFYRRANDVGDLPAEASTALARVGASCDPAERTRALDRLARLAREALSAPDRADALYRLAEAQLATAETREAGLDTLSAAMEAMTIPERALGIVRDAVVPNEELWRVLPLYERLARASNDERMLLDCLERRASASGATIENAREGYDLAVALHEDARAEALLERVVAIGRLPSGVAPEATWGLLELAKRRRASGDLAGAHRALADALEIGDPAPVLALLRELASAALAAADATSAPEALAVAAGIHETLRARASGDAQPGEKLLDLYARMNDRGRLGQLVSEMLVELADPKARNRVRMRFVGFLLGQPDDLAAIEVLRDVVLDEPEHEEATAHLAALYERHHEDGLLAEILDRRRRVLADRGDLDGVREAVLKLVAVTGGERPDAALEVLRWALERLPGEAPFVEAVLALLAPDAGEARLEAIEALLSGQPRQAEVRAAREARYRAMEMWEPLARVLVESAEHEKAPAQGAARLREAAGIHRNHLFDFSTAAELLRKARALNPQDVDLVSDLTRLLVELGEPQKALAETLIACRTPDLPPPVRARMLRLRADMLIEQGKRDAAIPVLLEALAGSTAETKKEIQAMIERLRAEGAKAPSAPPLPPRTPEPPPAADEELLEVTLVAETTQH
jgi:tetratricopeptide (TPR) repeat protein